MAPTPNSAIPVTTLETLQRIEGLFHLDEKKLHQITAQFVTDFGVGLNKYGEGMAMVPTFVTGVPNGTEKG